MSDRHGETQRVHDRVIVLKRFMQTMADFDVPRLLLSLDVDGFIDTMDSSLYPECTNYTFDS